MSTADYSSFLALSLLRQSCPPSQSFVLSPFSLTTALSIVHDGANGDTQKELANALFNDVIPSDHYLSLAQSLPCTRQDKYSVAFKSATRFYVDDKISLKKNYQRDIDQKYNVKVKSFKLACKDGAAREINEFVKNQTEGKIAEVLKPDAIGDDVQAYLMNAIYFLGKWLNPFKEKDTHEAIFKGYNGDRDMDFMKNRTYYSVNQNNAFGTVLLMPYIDEKRFEEYNFFYLMPSESSSLEKMRNEITGAHLINVLKNAEELYTEITIPKLKIESKLGGVEVLKKFGVKRLFGPEAELSKISNDPLCISRILHSTAIEMDEEGTEAASATVVEMLMGSCGMPDEPPPSIVIDRPFLFGILHKDHILFIGQYV